MLAPPDRAQRHRLAASGRAQPDRPTLYFQWEPFADMAREIAPLFVRHWRELALNQDTIPLDPDYDRYFALERAGILHVMTARQKDTGRLRGYVFAVLGPHLHYVSTPWCMVDMYWLEPQFRVGWTGVRMLKTFEAGMIERGAKVIMAVEKLHFGGTHAHGRNTGAIWQFLGYDPIEQAFAKRVG